MDHRFDTRSGTTTGAILQLLEEILSELKHANSSERTGAVSSVQIEDLAGKPPKVTSKHYTGSVAEIDQTIADHAYAKQLANAAYLRDWEVTLEQLKAARA